MNTNMAIAMTETTNAAQLLKLMSWLSPVFPIGGFAYSAGLEQAVQSSHVSDQSSLSDWIRVQITQGAQWNDSVLLAEAHRRVGQKPELEEVTDLCLALCVGQQRLDEARGQGTSFIRAVSHWVSPAHFPDRDTPLPVAIGIAAGVDGIELSLTAGAYLHAFVSNQLQCAIRLSVTGQDGAAKILAGLEPVVEATALRATASTLEDLGAATFMADIASLNHETLEPRLFLS
ncbi:urease accessory protein UreF [Hoeflea halophila]|nr:urease accessory UreF family protein [Hoeflea halophila]